MGNTQKEQILQDKCAQCMMGSRVAAGVCVYAYSRPGSSANTDLAPVNVAASILKPIWEMAGMSSDLQHSAGTHTRR